MASIKSFNQRLKMKDKFDEFKHKWIEYNDKFDEIHKLLSVNYTEFIIKKIKFEYACSLTRIFFIDDLENGFLPEERAPRYEERVFVSKSLIYCSCLKLIYLGK